MFYLVKQNMDQIKEAFLYLNRLIMDKYVHEKDVKSMMDELLRKDVLLTQDKAKEIVELYCTVKRQI